MSKLYFAPLEDAFYLRSDNIKDTQKEIDNLKKIINSSQLEKRPTGNEISKVEDNPQKDKRVLNSDLVTAQFGKSDKNADMDILKLIHHPKFEEIVKNYIIVKRPEWINTRLKSTSYQGSNYLGNQGSSYQANQAAQRSNFGNLYASTPYSNITNYLLFFIISLIVYFLLEKFFKS
jgi:hypothetical protein